jgi:hypothetical protein
MSWLTLYKMSTVMNCIRLYRAIYLKTPKLVTRAHLPSCMSFKTQVMLATVEVKGAATEGSASDKEIPM